MMKRKVVKHGLATLIVSLPLKWAREHGIDKGDEIDVVEEGDILVISKQGRMKEMSVEADISNLDRTSIMHTIRGFYRLGYDTVKLNFDKPTCRYQRSGKEVSVLSVIHTEVNRLIGYEILQEREKFCLIKDVQETSEKDFDNILRRVFLLLVDASKDFTEAVKTMNVSMLETIEDKHDTITKFVSYCMRTLNKRSVIPKSKVSYYYHIIACLDRITDIIKYAARDMLKHGKPLNKATVAMIESITNDIRNYYELFYDFKNDKVLLMNSNRYKIEAMLRELPTSISSMNGLIAANLFHIDEILTDIIGARTALEY